MKRITLIASSICILLICTLMAMLVPNVSLNAQEETISTPGVPTGPVTGVVGQTLTYTAFGASSNLGHPIQYVIDWGDNTGVPWFPVGTTTATHVYINPGTYSVRAIARCSIHTSIVSSWSPAKIVAIASPTAPETISTPFISGPDSGKPNETLTYTAYNSFSNLGHPIQYFFNWGDGSNSGWLPGGTSFAAQAKHAYTQPGTYDIRVLAECTLHTNITSSWASKQVTIATEIISIPGAPVGPSSGFAGQTLTYTTSGSTSSLGHQIQYVFNWGDGYGSGWLPVGTTSASYAYANAGTYDVKVGSRCAIDTSVMSPWSAVTKVTISEIKIIIPTLTILHWVSTPALSGPTSGTEGQNLTFTASGSACNLKHDVNYNFDWGDGSTSGWLAVGTTSASHAWSKAGGYDVKVTARCASYTNILSSSSGMQHITISAVSPPPTTAPPTTAPPTTAPPTTTPPPTSTVPPPATPTTNPPVVTTYSASHITDQSAVLTGTLVSPGNASTIDVSFEYGKTNSYGNTTEVISKKIPGTFSAYISGLTPGTTYHFRALASDGSNKANGTDISFTTWTTPLTGEIAFVSNRDGNNEIYTMNADGSWPARLTNTLAFEDFPAWSPDGSRIVFTSNRDGNNEIYTMDYNGTNLTRLTNNPANERYPAWSPDGTLIAFVSDRDGNDEIYTMSSNGSNPSQLTKSAEIDTQPSWSPDGKYLAFASYRDGNYQIYVMDADGSNLKRLTNNSFNDTQPGWSPDGKKVAFVSNRDGNNEIYLMNPDGTDPKRLTNTVWDDNSASWSPDGTKLVFTSSRDGNSEIYVMNLDGTNQTRLTDNPGNDFRPTWSGTAPVLSHTGRIAFRTNRDGSNEIYTMNADGSNPVNLTGNSASDTHPSWSPDGSQMAFTSNRDGNNEIYLLNTGSSDQKRLTINAANDDEAAWSPDSKRIAFTSDRDGAKDIYLMNADGSNLVRLTTKGGNWPNWSPDGAKITFVSNRDGNNEIYVMNADGSNQTRLTNNNVADQYPVWSPEGQRIAFISQRDGNNELYMMNTDGSNTVRLTTSAAQESSPAWSWDGTLITFVSDQDGNREIYDFNISAGKSVRLTNNPASDEEPDWLPATKVDTKVISSSSATDGVTQVAVLTTANLDAIFLDANSVRLAGANPAGWTGEDADQDSDTDMLLIFKTGDLKLSDTGATLFGNTQDGKCIQGTVVMNP